MVLTNIQPSVIIRRGLDLVGFTAARQRRTKLSTNVDRFRSSFGAGPRACAKIFRDLQTTNIADARIERPNLIYFLIAINWLATYKKEAEMAGYFQLDDKTLRKYIAIYVDAIAALKEQKICWKDLNSLTERFVLSVDGVHFYIKEPRMNPDSHWCSYKYKVPALAYEIAISPYRNEILWVSGPFKAATHDLTIYRRPGGLRSRIPGGKRVIADRGYKGETKYGGPTTLSIRNEIDTPAVREFKRNVRARHENLNARLKKFAVLGTRFRHHVDKHAQVMDAVCVIVQYDIENGHPLMKI